MVGLSKADTARRKVLQYEFRKLLKTEALAADRDDFARQLIEFGQLFTVTFRYRYVLFLTSLFFGQSLR